jgi:hypothetical protein
MYAISDECEQDWRDKEDCGPAPGGAEEGNGLPAACRRHDPEYKQRSDSRTPGQIFDFLGKRKGLPTACVDIAPPEKWPGERTGKNVESNNRAPVGSGLTVAAVHIDRSLSRRYSFGRGVGVCARQRFVLARGQDYSFLLHVLTDRGRISGHPDIDLKNGVLSEWATIRNEGMTRVLNSFGRCSGAKRLRISSPRSVFSIWRKQAGRFRVWARGARLSFWELVLPNQRKIETVVANMSSAGYNVESLAGVGPVVVDPWGIREALVTPR